MKILEIKDLELSGIKTIKFARFGDHRGYFTEQFRRSDFKNSGIESLASQELVQANQSYSKEGVVRGLHFQWNPYMGKLVRTLSGHMVDLMLDIRKGSETFGQAIAYDMPASEENNFDEWLWVPAGFAHGNYFLKPTTIEYMCTGEYSQCCEAGISPFSKDINWNLCNSKLKDDFDKIVNSNVLITDKDKNAMSVNDWSKDIRSNNFIYSDLKNKKLC